MDFFGYKRGRILLVMAVICLFAFVVWPFLRGGRSMIQTDFIPLNTQMQAMISKSGEEEPVPEAKLTRKLDSKTNIDAEPKATIPGSTQIPASAPISTAIPAPAVVPTEKPEASLSAAQSSGRLDLNSATLEQLDEIPGIGESKAKAIMDYRLKKGRFSRIEELIEVKGIGEKMLEKLKAFLYVT